jgi:hypothetical protein
VITIGPAFAAPARTKGAGEPDRGSPLRGNRSFERANPVFPSPCPSRSPLIANSPIHYETRARAGFYKSASGEDEIAAELSSNVCKYGLRIPIMRQAHRARMSISLNKC